MTLTRVFYAEDLLRLTVEDIEKQRYFKVEDNHNVTEEHRQHLRDLIRRRDQKHQSIAVNADDLGDRLRQIASRDNSPASSCRTLTLEETKEDDLRVATEAYHTLLQDGGQPSHPISLGLGYDVEDEPEEYKDIIWFWRFFATDRFFYPNQLGEWKDFREDQSKIRRYYVPRKRFHEYEQVLRESGQNMGSQWDIAVHQDLEKQTRLENWNEYRAYHYRKLKSFHEKVKRAQVILDSKQKNLQDTIPRLSEAVTDDDILFERVEELVASTQRKLQAEKGVELAQEKLKAAESEEQKDATKRAAAVQQAQKELQSAMQTLDEAAESDEIRRLHEGYELMGLRSGVTAARRDLGYWNLKVKRWEVFLEWIDQQLPVIAGECALSQQRAEDAKSASLSKSKRPRRYTRSDRKPSRPQQTRCPKKLLDSPPPLSLRPTHTSRVSKHVRKDPCPIRRVQTRSLIRHQTSGITKPGYKRDGETSSLGQPLEYCQSKETQLLVVPGNPQRRSDRLAKPKKDIPWLGPIHSSKISKVSTKTASRVLTSHRTLRPLDGQRRKILEASTSQSARSAVKKAKPQTTSTPVTLRRSQRILERS